MHRARRALVALVGPKVVEACLFRSVGELEPDGQFALAGKRGTIAAVNGRSSPPATS